MVTEAKDCSKGSMSLQTIPLYMHLSGWGQELHFFCGSNILNNKVSMPLVGCAQ